MSVCSPGLSPGDIACLGFIRNASRFWETSSSTVFPTPGVFNPAVIRSALGIPHSAKIFVAGSTRPGEEEIIAAAFASVVKEMPDSVMILAPRHLNRLEEVERVLDAAGLPFVKRSAGVKLNETEARTLILDSIGELQGVFACAEAAFVGGSLRDYGGHNPLEPAALGVPVLFGPYMEQTGAKELLTGGAASVGP